jgi:hypothetical protein
MRYNFEARIHVYICACMCVCVCVCVCACVCAGARVCTSVMHNHDAQKPLLSCSGCKRMALFHMYRARTRRVPVQLDGNGQYWNCLFGLHGYWRRFCGVLLICSSLRAVNQSSSWEQPGKNTGRMGMAPPNGGEMTAMVGCVSVVTSAVGFRRIRNII